MLRHIYLPPPAVRYHLSQVPEFWFVVFDHEMCVNLPTDCLNVAAMVDHGMWRNQGVGVVHILGPDFAMVGVGQGRLGNKRIQIMLQLCKKNHSRQHYRNSLVIH